MFSGWRRAAWLTPLLGLCACSSLSLEAGLPESDLAVTSILNNSDDDDGNGVPDNLDDIVNGSEDFADLTTIRVTLPGSAFGIKRATLSLSPEAIGRLRVFQRTAPGTAVPLADGDTLGLGAREGRTLTLLVEATQPASAEWNGIASVAVTTHTRLGNSERRAVMLRVAP